MKTSHGYKWQYVDKNKINNYVKQIPKILKSRDKKLMTHYLTKRTAQIDPITKKIINIYDSIRLANDALNLKNSSCISGACNKKMGIVYGYHWCFVNDNNYKIGDIVDMDISQRSITQTINQIDTITNNIINTFDSIKLACKSLNIKYNSIITKCCKGKVKTAYGYK